MKSKRFFMLALMLQGVSFAGAQYSTQAFIQLPPYVILPPLQGSVGDVWGTLTPGVKPPGLPPKNTVSGAEESEAEGPSIQPIYQDY